MYDFRHAIRSLARSPGFVSISIVALALGLGLATTMFGVMDAVVNPYSPYRDADELFELHWRLPRFTTVSAADVQREVMRDRVFVDAVPVAHELQALETGGLAREVLVGLVPGRYFAVMGVRPVFGRLLTASETGDAVLVGMPLWQRLYGTRRSLDSAFVTLGTVTYRIVGVLPDGASHPNGALVWRVIPAGWEARPFTIVGRARPGVDYLRLLRLLEPAGARLSAQHLASNPPPEHPRSVDRIVIGPAPVRARGEQLRDIHYAMVAAAVLVLLIACANLAHLMLARGLSKRRELAVRMAVGAGRGTIVRQMFAECLVVTAAGAGLGAVVALWGADLIAGIMPTDVAWVGLVKPHLSWRVFATGAACAGLAALVFGLLPALGIALNISLDEPLKDGAGTTGRARQRYSPLVVFEVALALVLLMAGGLLLRTVHDLSREDFGAANRNVLSGAVWMPRCATDRTSAICRRQLFRDATPVNFDELLTAMATAPGVTEAAFVGTAPPEGGLITAELTGRDSTRSFWMVSYPVVSPSYLRTLRLPILSGRDFEPGDMAGTGVAIIDPVAADRLYPRQDPVGRMLKLGRAESDAPWVRIVGIARNPAALQRGDDPLQPALWVARPLPVETRQFVARTEEGSRARSMVEIRRALMTIPGVSNVRIEPFGARRQAVLDSRRFLANVFVAMGAVALALSALGLYGVLAYSVTQRLREFAVRVAVGARPPQVARLVLHDTLVMLLAGIGIGAFVALITTRFVDRLISGLYHTDVLTLVTAEALLLLAGLVAAWSPARRAARANPLDILRAV
jgi:putative ABC transport system permease protein